MKLLDVSNAKVLRRFEERDTLKQCDYILTFYSLVVGDKEGRCYEVRKVCDKEESAIYGTADELIQKYEESADPSLETLTGKHQFVYNYVKNLNAVPIFLIIKIVVFLLLELLRYIWDKKHYKKVEKWFDDSKNTFNNYKYISYETALDIYKKGM